MADTVHTHVLFDGERHYAVQLTCESDGTGESAVQKVDISTLDAPRNPEDGSTTPCTYTNIDKIVYQVNGFNSVSLDWDHTTDDNIAILSGNGWIDYTKYGGNTDPQSAGGTGDILLTSNGAISGASYNIVIYLVKKA